MKVLLLFVQFDFAKAENLAFSFH